jgi:SPOR domain
MSMADDNTKRSYRSNDAYRRGASQPDAQDTAFEGSDPLAELARLIGQNDPFNEPGRRPSQNPAPRAAQHSYDDAPPGDWRRHVERPNYGVRDEPAFDDTRYGNDQGYAPDQGYASDERYASDPGSADDAHAQHDPYRMELPQQDARYQDGRYQDSRYDEPLANFREDTAYAAADDYRDEQMYAAPHRGGAHRDGTHHIGQHHGGGMGAVPDEDYDDPPRRKRGSSLVTAVVLIGCAMLGTAGAYGYRTYTASSGSAQAPVITADSAPNKIVPAEPKSGRSQERIGGQGGDERLVSREEQPVALQGTSGVPRVVFPSPVQPAPATTGTTNPQAAGVDQPKSVRTVPIRPDGGDNSGRPLNDDASQTAPPTRGAPNARTATTTPPPPPAQRAPGREQPLSLDPASSPQASEPARPQQRQPTPPPAPRETAAPAPRVAAVPPATSNGGSGGFIVQVSSQRSEADAQASYRALQTKYSQLKSHQPIIRRADLGQKGVYYRAMVGPFESGDEAVRFCNDLKQAGGQCIIHRN